MIDKPTPASSSVPTSSAGGRIAATTLAVLVHIALVSAAVETFRSGSLVRWWVLGIVAAYVVALLAGWRVAPSLWKRVTPTGLATSGGGLFLGLLAMTAWLPGGQVVGVRLAGQSTSTVLSVVTVAAVALSAIVLLRALKSAPFLLRAGVVALAAYALIAYALGIAKHTSYPELLTGGSLWVRLPFWLQGAFIGALVLLPLALTAGLITDLKERRRRAGPHKSRLRQILALGLSFLIALSAQGLPLTSRSTDQTGRGVPVLSARGDQPSVAELRQPLSKARQELATALGINTDPDKLTTTDLANRMESTFTEIEAADRELSRDTFDVEAVAKRVGPDRVRLFEWVRDNTDLVPYRGALRGPTGVLMDRLGNSLDRALLLAELLRTTGASVRLAHGTLSSQTASNLLAVSRPAPERRPMRPSPDFQAALDQAIAAQANTNRLDAARLHKAMDLVAAEAQASAQQFERGVKDQADAIAGLLRTPATVSKEISDRPSESLRDHWWVQIQQGAEWLDLDPATPNARPGEATVAATEFVAPADLPGEVFHEVTIRIIVEQWREHAVKESTVLERRLRPYELLGRNISLRHVPADWPKALDFDNADARTKVEQALMAQTEWVPVLQIGTETMKQHSFTDAGRVNDTPHLGPQSKTLQSPAGGPLDAFGGGGDATDEPEGDLSAEWIEYEIRTPGQPTRSIRRDVFDLIGPAARSAPQVRKPDLAGPVKLDRALALLGETEILLVTSDLSPEFAIHLAATQLLDQREPLRELTQAGGNKSRNRLMELAGKLRSTQSELYSFVLIRHLLSPVGNDVYVDRPNIISYHKGIRTSDKGEGVLIKDFDIVANDVGIRSAGDTNGFRTRLVQGVVDTAAEALVVGSCQACGPVGNVSGLWTSTHQQTPWVLLRSLDDPAWERVRLSDDSRRRVQHDVSGGYTVLVAPGSTTAGGRERVGWWRIDPATGGTLGIMASGQGQATLEHALAVGANSFAANVGLLAYWACGAFNLGTSQVKHESCFVCAIGIGFTTGIGIFALYFAAPLLGAVLFVLTIAFAIQCAYASNRP